MLNWRYLYNISLGFLSRQLALVSEVRSHLELGCPEPSDYVW